MVHILDQCEPHVQQLDRSMDRIVSGLTAIGGIALREYSENCQAKKLFAGGLMPPPDFMGAARDHIPITQTSTVDERRASFEIHEFGPLSGNGTYGPTDSDDKLAWMLDVCSRAIAETHMRPPVRTLFLWKYRYRRDTGRTVLIFRSPSSDSFQRPSRLAPLYVWLLRPSPSVGDRIAMAYDLTMNTIWLGQLLGSDPELLPFVAGWGKVEGIQECVGATNPEHQPMDTLRKDLKAIGKLLMNIGLWKHFTDNKGMKRADGLMERSVNDCSQDNMNLLRPRWEATTRRQLNFALNAILRRGVIATGSQHTCSRALRDASSTPLRLDAGPRLKN
ncbi:hypothetical protein BDV19DRAFT_389487 [Aspergillus venezuelensis]